MKTKSFEAVQITDHVYWVGAVDWAVRDFHGYHTGRGSTYNAYLIMADKVTLVDTVKAKFKEEMLLRIASVIGPEKIDYVVSNHAEMDHTGCLKDIIALVKPERVFASRKGVDAFVQHFGACHPMQALEDGGQLSLGNMELSVAETPMLHWPDSMMTFLDKDKVLFSQDGFGMHLASGGRFADEIDESILEFEGRKYFANILLPFSKIVLKLFDKLAKTGWQFDVIAPDHGPIWREDIGKILAFYKTWAEQGPTSRALIIYDTMWGSTEQMARVIAEGIWDAGASAKVLNVRGSHRSEIATEISESGALVVGSPTLNNNVFPSLTDVLTYLKGLKPQNLSGGAFGSYGWSGEAVRHIEEFLGQMKIELPFDGLRVKYVPDEEALGECRAWGEQLGERLSENKA